MGREYDGPPESAWIHVEVWGQEDSWTALTGYCTADRDGGSETFDDGVETQHDSRRSAMTDALVRATSLSDSYPDATHIEITGKPYMRAEVWL